MTTDETAKSRSWIVMADEEMTTAALETAVEKRLAERRTTLGRPSPVDFPAFGYRTPMPEPPASGAVSQTLHHHLRQLNRMEPPETTPVLIPSPATRIPILGRLWAVIREHAHRLVLFYVNRASARETAVNNHIMNALNELTRLAQSQQDEIRRLQKEIDRRHKTEHHD
ncbi:MAG: hypothetical protein GY803_02425 [Chloroflexi bacterium]|nr:hypothetical protein [Chloroflexota bacterium]